jgi:hypothetical protein
MSCESENSCPGISIFKVLFLLLLAAIVISSHKEILRYIKISSM